MRKTRRFASVLALLLAAGPAAGGSRNLQILIEVKLVEASPSFMRDLGVEWGAAGPTAQPLSQPVLGNLPAIGKLFDGSRGNVIAEPTVLTRGGQESRVFVGGDLDVGERSFDDVGIGLEFIPEVTDDLQIQLQILADIDQFGTTPGMIPQISSRTIQSRVLLDNGGTAVIGGLFTDQTRQTAARVPWLGDVPILGFLFGRPEFGRAETDLLIFVTPRIIGEGGRSAPSVRVPRVDPELHSPQTPHPQPHPKTSPGSVR